jgi:fatty acid kinase fatty acid binding subunit
MSSVAICTDSSTLFPEGVAEQLGVTIVPVAITLDGRVVDEHATPIDDFYARMSAGERATTSHPSPGELLDAYSTLASGGASDVLSIHLDARVSGTTGSAELAAREAPIPVTVADTRTVSFGVGLCVRAAAQALGAGASVHDAASLVAAAGTRQRNVFVAPQGPPGRLPEAAGWAVLEFADGAARPVGVRDNIGEAIDAMLASVLGEELPLRAAVGHACAATEPAADALARSLAGLSQIVEVERYRVGAAVGAHTGPFTFGAFWWPAQ